MFSIVDNGWITTACRRPSANCDERPVDGAIELLVIHGISLPAGQFGDGWIEDLFCNQLDPAAHSSFAELSELRVSAHVLIRRDGSVIQFVPFEKRAWHAGASNFEGRERCNDFSIGIELEGTDTIAYEPVQYRMLARLTRLLMNVYPGITPSQVVGHCDIAPGRKSDPGPSFDWALFRTMLQDDVGSVTEG